ATTAKMLHFIMGLSTLMLIYCGVSKSFKLKYSGLTAVLFFYSQDTVSFNSWHSGNDVASTFFFTAALSAALNLSRKNKIEFFYISSIFLGLTMGVKYTAFFSVAGLFAVLSFYLFKMPDLKFKRVSICLLKSAAIIFLIMAPWFLKNFWNTGNPVYPFLSDVFNNENLAETGVSKNILNLKSKIFSFSFQKFFYSFWDLTMSNSEGGILFLAFLPLAVLVFVRRETNAAILLFGFGVSYFFWYAGGLGDYRLLMPATVILSAITSFCVCLTAEKNKIIFIPAFFIILLSFFFNNLMLFENIRVAEYFQKKISLSDYLSKPKMLFPRYCYKTIEWANSNLDSKSKIMLVGESRGYYIKNKYAGYSVELNKQPLMEFIKNAVDANDLYEKIRQSGITHLLINYWEAMRVNPSYNTFYWNRKDRIVFDEFWKKHISLEYFKHGSFLYKINASVAKGKSPLNLLEELEKNKWDKSRILNIYYKNREYDYMIDEYEFLQTVGFETGQMISEIKKLKKYYCCK
ncbi:MAG TPA: glycosyltransferase family 39 protein, partial [bacterium]|nr:glycosyltransferase family 39 protein [bacterium]